MENKNQMDEPLETDLNREWLSIVKDINRLPSISIDRRYTSTTFDPTKLKLHTFMDASTKAYYGAVTFLSSGDHVSFIMAKSHVAPLKVTTLPRLELIAAVVGARITKFIMTSLKLESTSMYCISGLTVRLPCTGLTYQKSYRHSLLTASGRFTN